MAEINNAKVIVDYADMQAIANAIRTRTNSTDGITITEMPTQIGGIVGGEDVAVETAAYTNELVELQTKITALEGALEGKASGGSDSTGEIATCTIKIVNETIGKMMESYLTEIWYVAYENGEFKGYGGSHNSLQYNILPDNFDWSAETIILNNVVCGSMMLLDDDNTTLTYPAGWMINSSINFRFALVPYNTSNATHTITMTSPF